MKKLTLQVQRQITADWWSAFPEFSIFEPMQLLKRCGPLLLGIYLRHDRNDDFYTPTAHIHCLARPNSSIVLSLHRTLRVPRTNAPLRIRAAWHTRDWRQVAARLAEQYHPPLLGPVTLEQVSEAFKRYAADPEYGEDPYVYEDWILTTAWAGRMDEVRGVLEEARRDMSEWPKHIFYNHGGMNTWFRRIEKKTSDPDKLRLIVEKELVKHKAEHLPAVDVSSWFADSPPPLPKPPRRKPEPSAATRLRQVSRNCLHGAPVPPTLRALWETGAEDGWLLQGAELELLTSPKEALRSLQEDPEESPALARAQTRLFEEMALVAWSGEGHYLALWRAAPAQGWEQAYAVALNEKVGYYCKGASLADQVVLALGEREEEALAWFRERGSHVSASVAEAQARLRRLPSPWYRLYRYLEEEEAWAQGKVLPALPATRTAEPQQLVDLLGMSAEDPRVEALLQKLSVADKPLGLERDGWGRVAKLSCHRESLLAQLSLEGIHFNDTQAQVHSKLGKPSASGQDWERYDRRERGLRLYYVWGKVRVMSLLWLPAVPEPLR